MRKMAVLLVFTVLVSACGREQESRDKAVPETVVVETGASPEEEIVQEFVDQIDANGDGIVDYEPLPSCDDLVMAVADPHAEGILSGCGWDIDIDPANIVFAGSGSQDCPNGVMVQIDASDNAEETGTWLGIEGEPFQFLATKDYTVDNVALICGT